MGPIIFSLEETNNLEPSHLEQMLLTTVSEVQSLPGDFGYGSRQKPLEPISQFTQKLVFDYKLWNQSMNQILLIDSKLPNFTNYTNSNTFPIIYDHMCCGDQLIETLNELYSTSKIKRIAIVSHYDNNPIFLDNTPLFESLLITNIIKKFKIENIDFLACDTLNSEPWKNFYSMLHDTTNVIVGASNNKTGNIKYGGDWIMESTSEDISIIYFNDHIQEYTSLLDETQQGLTLVSLESPINLPTVYEDASNVQIDFIRMLFDLSYNDDITDESIDAFVVKSVDSGSLKIGNSNWDANTNNIIDASHSAYWTPTLYTNGLLPAFKVAIRNTLFTESATTADVKIYVTHVNHKPSGIVTITGIVEQGRTLTADTTLLVDIDGIRAFSYQWDISGVDISGATSMTYKLTQVEVGKTVGVTIKYTDAQGAHESVKSLQTSVVANVNDVPTGTLTISGIPAQYQTLTADTRSLADIDGLGQFSYQWDASGVDISGATSSTYTLTENEIGKRIRVVVKYTDAQGTDEMFTSQQTVSVNQSPVLVSMESPINLPTVYEDASNVQIDFIRLLFDLSYNDDIEEDSIGSFVVKSVDSGGSLKIGNSIWDASTNNIIDASHSAYWTPALYTSGLLPAFKVSIRDKLLGESNTFADINIAVTHVNHLPSGGVTITGIPKQDQTLTAQNNIEDHDGKVSLTYQWKSNDVDISGANTATLVLKEPLVTKVIKVVATYIDRYGISTSVSSLGTSPIENINDQYSGGVTITGIPITGKPIQGQTLTANNSLDDPDIIILLNYKWQADGVDISGANTGVLVLGEAQVNKSIKVIATYTDTYNNITSVSSTSTLPVENVNNPYTGSVRISNMNPIQTDTLIATNDLVDSDGINLLTYQWKEDGVDISGATNATLTLRPAQINKVITVVATYLDLYGNITTVSSIGTESVQTVSNLRSGHVDISGIFTQGETLTATNTLIDYYGIVSFTYQWTADNVYISGANSITLVLGETMVNKVINLVVTYVNSISETFTVSSANTQAIANVNDNYSGSILISGLAIQGETLTIKNTLADSDGIISLSYQWKANNVNISGATNNTLLLTDVHVNKVIIVVVTYVDSYGVSTSVSSANEMVPETNITFDSMTGTIIDGYISGANISIRYINGDRVPGINDVSSNAYGNFNILGVFPTPYYKIICSGGTDLATGQPLLYPLSIVVNNPSGSATPLKSTSNISPLTTIVSDIVTSQATLGQTINISAATLSVATALGINAADIGVDYLATNNTSIAKASVKIATIISIIATSTTIPVLDIAKSLSTIISTSTAPLVINSTFVNNVVNTSIPVGNATPIVDNNIITLVTAVSNNVNTSTDLTSIYKASIGGTTVAQNLTPTTNVSTALNTATTAATIGVLVPVIPGSVVINGYVGSPREGDILTANVTDGNGLNGVTISYFWYADNSRLMDIPIISQTLPLLLSYVGKPIKVQVTYTDNSSSLESVTSANTPTVLPANLNYTIINSSNVSVTSLVSSSITSVNIPSKIYISGTIYNVTSIGDNPFQNCTNLVSITIPSSVTSIGENAFQNTSITSVIIPMSVISIGTYAFYYSTKLTSVEISSSVTSIGANTFTLCALLENINVANDNLNYCSIDGVLFNKSITKLIQYPIGNSRTTYTIPVSVTTIGHHAFDSCKKLSSIILSSVTTIEIGAFVSCSNLISITIPNSVTSIGPNVFQSCNMLSSITIPNSVISIGDYAFNECINLGNINVVDENQYYRSIDGVLFNKSKTTLIQYPIGNSRTTYTIPSFVTIIGLTAFRKCTLLNSVKLPTSGLITIGQQAFESCINLTSIIIPSSVTAIGHLAFIGCTQLLSVYFVGNYPTVDDRGFATNGNTAYHLSSSSGFTPVPIEFSYSQSLTVLSAPTSFELTSGIGQITISNIINGVSGGWSIDKYAYNISTSPTIWSNSDVDFTGPSITITSGIIAEQTYYIKLKSHNSDGYSDYSTYIQIKPTLGVPITIKGVVIDGYIKNATITIKDLAGVSRGTTTSDENGNYTLPATLLPNTTYIITCVGGIDIATNLPLTYPLSCVYVTGATVVNVTNININPLTTIVASLVASGQTLSAATAKVVTALGITSLNITSDYIGVPNTSVAIAAVKVATLIITLLTATAAAGYTGAEVVTAVAQIIGAQTVPINFTQTSLITSVVTAINTNNTSSVDIAAQTVTNISAVISQVSTTLDAVNASGTNSVTDLTNIYKTSIGAQAVVTTNVSTINSATIPNVSTAITTAISTAAVGQIKSNICFKAGTKIVTDQGIVNIEQITEQNSIRGKKVLYVSKTENISDDMILIKKDGLYDSVPNADTYITEEHKIFYNREMIKVKHLVNGETIIRKKMRKEIVYNVLLEGETSGKMIANGLISETLDPRSPMVKILLTLEEMCDTDKEEIINAVNKKMKKEHEKRKRL